MIRNSFKRALDTSDLKYSLLDASSLKSGELISFRNYEATSDFESTDCTDFFQQVIESKDLCHLEEIMKSFNDFPITMTCPKTNLNILQYSAICNKTSDQIQKILSFLITQEQPSQALNLIFGTKGKGGPLVCPVVRESESRITENHCPLQKGGHPSSELSAFELAIIHRNHQVLSLFGEFFQRAKNKLDEVEFSTDESQGWIKQFEKRVIQSALKIILKYDRGSTLAYLVESNVLLGWVKDRALFHTVDNSEKLIHLGCMYQAKHCLRFLLSLYPCVLETLDRRVHMDRLYKDMTPYEITLFYGLKKKPSKKVIDNQTVPEILQELVQAEKRLTRQGKRKEAPVLPDLDEYLYKYGKVTRSQIQRILKERQDFNNKLQFNKDGSVDRLQGVMDTLLGTWSPFYTTLFYTLFFAIVLSNITIVQPKLKVWYFIFSTTSTSLKLFFTYRQTHNKDPGYLHKCLDLDFTTKILRDVPQEFICPKCKVIRTDSTVHCPVVDRCIDRYDQFSSFANTPVGRGNHGFYFAFIFFFWLDVFLVGWIDVESFRVTACELPEGCPLEFLCIGNLCNSLPLHYLSTVVGAVVCIYFFFPSQVLCCRHSYYFGINQTTFQRRPKLRYQDMAFADSYSRPKKSKSCCYNYRVMTCRRKVKDQQALYDELRAQAKTSGCPVQHGQ